MEVFTFYQKDTSKKFMTRNVYQVIGKDLESPSKFVVCWTPKGEIVGGTAQAMKLAQKLDIPIFNLYNANTKNELIDFVSGIIDV